MQVLCVAHAFPPESWSGTEVCVLGLATELATRHNVAVFHGTNAPGQEGRVSRTSCSGVPVYRVGANTARRDVYHELDAPAVNEAFRAVLGEFQPDVVHFHHVCGLSVSLPAVARGFGCPVVFTLHDLWLMCPRLRLIRRDGSLCDDPRAGLACHECEPPPSPTLKRRLQSSFRRFLERLTGTSLVNDASEQLRYLYREFAIRQMAEQVDMFISPSRFLREQFLSWGIPAEKLVHIEHGFDTRKFEGFERRPSSKLRFGFVGILCEEKGADLAVEAFRQIGSPRAELTLNGRWGHPAFEQRLRAMADGQNIRFAGPFENTQVARVFSEIDVLLFPSRWYENSPMTIREAFLARTPVITADCGGMAELVQHGVNGLLFRRGDAADLSSQMRKVVEEPGLLERLRAGIPPVRSLADHARDIEAVYALARIRRAEAPPHRADLALGRGAAILGQTRQ